ncbi:hypothetical protein EW093_17195 (plasmid) [Thiospirochaeta perfilievii]|uniref:Uncharacterized protein n=1 Tax=Thiospirochaeta perfilievii TaxID=252967 RepID=A0A5C1QEF4_9SPIO|nr:hypothetical protein [Thiospirochaeta perfilievii]QEN06443.1 hypothetical protein EW093_17195 [Thiospirochaeta perfilievii]
MARPREYGSILNFLEELEITDSKDQKTITNITDDINVRSTISSLDKESIFSLLNNILILSKAGLKPKEIKSYIDNPLGSFFSSSINTQLDIIEVKSKYLMEFFTAFKRLDLKQFEKKHLYEFSFKDYFSNSDLATYNNFILLSQIEEFERSENLNAQVDIAYKYYLMEELGIAEQLIDTTLNKNPSFGYATYVKVLILYKKRNHRYIEASKERLRAENERSYVNQSIMEDRADAIAHQGYMYYKESFRYILLALKNWKVKRKYEKFLSYEDSTTRDKIFQWALDLTYKFCFNNDQIICEELVPITKLVDEVISNNYSSIRYTTSDSTLESLKFIFIMNYIKHAKTKESTVFILEYLKENFIEVSNFIKQSFLLDIALDIAFTLDQQKEFIKKNEELCVSHFRYNSLVKKYSISSQEINLQLKSNKFKEAYNIAFSDAKKIKTQIDSFPLENEYLKKLYICCEIISAVSNDEYDFKDFSWAIKSLEGLFLLTPDIFTLFNNHHLSEYVDYYRDSDGLVEVYSHTPLNNPYLMYDCYLGVWEDSSKERTFNFIRVINKIIEEANKLKLPIPARILKTLHNVKEIEYSNWG